MNSDTTKILDFLSELNNGEFNQKFSNKNICKFTDEQRTEYETLLKKLIDVHEKDHFTTKEKGELLEKISAFVLEKSGSLFSVQKNVRTRTNELDQLVSLNPSGKFFAKNGLISNYFENFICECKNYNKKVSVTYVGKLYSLMQTCNLNFSILFSYYGVTGSGWNDSSGLIRKIYLSTNGSHNNSCIIDFNLTDFKAIKDGDNLLDIVERKIQSLKYDTDFSEYIKPHPAETILK